MAKKAKKDPAPKPAPKKDQPIPVGWADWQVAIYEQMTPEQTLCSGAWKLRPHQRVQAKVCVEGRGANPEDFDLAIVVPQHFTNVKATAVDDDVPGLIEIHGPCSLAFSVKSRSVDQRQVTLLVRRGYEPK